MSNPGRASTLLRSLASSWLGLAVGVVISFFLSPFVVNKVGAAWYGVWAVAAQFVGYLYLLDFGVRESVVRHTSKYAATRNAAALNRVLSTSLVIYGLITSIAILATSVGVLGLPHWFNLAPEFWKDSRIVVAFTGLTIAQTFFFNVFNGIVIGLRRWELTNAIGVGLNLLRAALIVYFLQSGYGIVAVAAVQFGVAVAGGLVNCFAALWLLKREQLNFRFVRLPLRKLVAIGRRILGYGFYVIVNNVGEKIIAATDAIIVGVFMPITAVAYYAVAGSLIGYVRSLLSTSAYIFNPLASELHSLRQGDQLAGAFLLGVKICVLISLPIVASFVLLGKQFIGLWMGVEFAAPSSTVLAILAVAVFFSSPQYVISSVLYGMSKHRIIAVLRIAEAVANLGLSIALVRHMGLAGVALGTAIPSAIIAALVLPIVAVRPLGVALARFYEHAYVRPLISITPFAVASYWIGHDFPATDLLGFFLRILALLLLYVPCAFFVVLSRTERMLLLTRLLGRRN